MGGRTAYPWLSTPKITVEDRFYINLFSVFRPFGRLYRLFFINNIYINFLILRRTKFNEGTQKI